MRYDVSLHARQDHVEKVARSRDEVRALAEFVWNALDADATNVDVRFVTNSLGGIDAIYVEDNGNGIPLRLATTEFEALGDSWKRGARRTPSGRAVHGQEGKGRFKFFSISDHAYWSSTYRDGDRLGRTTIHIAAEKIDHASIEHSFLDEGALGTVVQLSPLKQDFSWLLTQEASAEISAIFATYLMQYQNVRIRYHERELDPRDNVFAYHKISTSPLIAGQRTIKDLSLKVIEWKSGPESRRINFGAQEGVVLGSQPASVTAPGFQFSAYATSQLFQEMADANILELEDLSDPVFKVVLDYIRDELSAYFRMRMSERASGLIDNLKATGVYPYTGEPSDDLERRERQVFDIATYAVSSYSPSFKKADTSLQRMTLTLLREAVRHNPDTLTHILTEVARLPKNRQDEFSDLLKKTELGNIINASSLIAGRVTFLETLKGVVFDPSHRATMRERGGLDVLIRDNTWIFGEEFHITLPEAGLTRVMQRVADDQKAGRAPGRVTKAEGKVGRVDIFLGRSVPQRNSKRKEYLVVELKRPSLPVARRELDQLEDYVQALTSQSDWSRTDTFWNFYLLTGDINDQIADRVTQKGRPAGLFIDKDNYRVWVKTWAELIRECEGQLSLIQDQLKIRVAADEIEQRISVIKDAYLRRSDAVATEEDLIEVVRSG